MTPPLIFLIGYRGTGKSTVARLLADRLGWSWVDADEVVEQQAGQSIREIFAAEGEAGFRRRESAVLVELCQRTNHVVATGGGVILDPANRERLRNAGHVVWLTAEPDTLLRRIEADRTTAARRPNLTVGGRTEIEQLLRVREPLYRDCAETVVATDHHSPDEIVAAILKSLNLG